MCSERLEGSPARLKGGEIGSPFQKFHTVASQTGDNNKWNFFPLTKGLEFY